MANVRVTEARRLATKLLVALAVFDLLLGGCALFAPDSYNALLHPLFEARHPDGPTYLIRRTGVLWLFFAAIEATAARRPGPELVFLVGMLRLMEVPADLVYSLASDDLGLFGRVALIGAPLFNLCAGAYLARLGSGELQIARAKVGS